MDRYTYQQMFSTLLFEAESFCETRKDQDGYRKITKRNHRKLAAMIFAIRQTLTAGYLDDYPTAEHWERLQALEFTFSKFVPKEGV